MVSLRSFRLDGCVLSALAPSGQSNVTRCTSPKLNSGSPDFTRGALSGRWPLCAALSLVAALCLVTAAAAAGDSSAALCTKAVMKQCPSLTARYNAGGAQLTSVEIEEDIRCCPISINSGSGYPALPAMVEARPSHADADIAIPDLTK